MTVRQSAVTVKRSSAPDPSLERIQREHELSRALEAARTLQARLEMIGDRADDARSVRRLRDDLAHELATGNKIGVVERKVADDVDEAGG